MSRVTLFLCGDVMTGRGIDQVLPHPSEPTLHEPYVKDAREYVAIAEASHGDICRPVDFAYIWGEALAELERVAPDARLINLETSVTRSDHPWPGKGIHYRMHPDNVPCLTAAAIDACALANNHVLDWGYAGLEETIAVLRRAGIRTAGAGPDRGSAAAPATLELDRARRVILVSAGVEDSGIPQAWAAAADSPGVNLLPDLSPQTAARLGERVEALKRPGDVVVFSVHWGANWGYAIPQAQRRFAHALIDAAGVDLVHGHSSHHVKGLEVYRDRLILYGCGDFLNDYEGIGGFEGFRDDLSLMYFPTLDPADGRLVDLRMIPTRIERLRVNRATLAEARWLTDTLNREGKALGTTVALDADAQLVLG